MGPVRRLGPKPLHERCKGRPVLCRPRRRPEKGQLLKCRTACQLVQEPSRDARANARQKLQNAEGHHPVKGIFSPAQHREQILDMGRFQEFEPAKFDERDVPAAELDFENSTVMACAKEYSLLLQRHAFFPVGKHAFHDELGLRRIVLNRDKSGLFRRATI